SVFVAVGAPSGGSCTILTGDGTTWTPRTTGTALKLYGVAGNNSATPLLVAVGEVGNVFVSTGGATWANPTGTTVPDVTLNGVAWQTANTFVAVGDNGAIWRSTSPAGSWTSIASPV